MKIAIGTDHRGFKHKNKIITSISNDVIEWVDLGCSSDKRCDFPEFAQKAAKLVQAKKVDAGILLCGSGIGMSIAANRFKYVYAALVWNVDVARSSKEHDNANILVLPADYISEQEAIAMINAWKDASFLGDRYQERLLMIDK